MYLKAVLIKRSVTVGETLRALLTCSKTSHVQGHTTLSQKAHQDVNEEHCFPLFSRVVTTAP